MGWNCGEVSHFFPFWPRGGGDGGKNGPSQSSLHKDEMTQDKSRGQHTERASHPRCGGTLGPERH